MVQLRFSNFDTFQPSSACDYLCKTSRRIQLELMLRIRRVLFDRRVAKSVEIIWIRDVFSFLFGLF